MLMELSIRNLAVIESVRASFGRGFHVLTGETGAGKSIIIDALTLVAGGRSSSELVRYGSDKAEIEASFELEPTHPVWGVLEKLGIEASADELIIVRRDITSQGKSTCRINGQLVNLSMLRETGDWLVNIHGQHEHQSLLRTDMHLQWLDLFGESEIREVKLQYQQIYAAYTQTNKELNQLREAGKQALQMLDLYTFQIEEIETAALKEREDELLAEEKRKLANAERMFQSVSDAYDAINMSGRGLTSTGKAMQKLEDVVAYDRTQLSPIYEQIQTAYYALEDAAFQLRDYREDIEFNPQRLEEIEQRLDLIASFRRKYGETVGDILQYLDKIKQDVQSITNKDETIRKLQGEADILLQKLVHLAIKLSAKRSEAANRLSEAIEKELRELHMERTKFKVQLQRVEDASGIEMDGVKVRLSREGADAAEFMISANPGEPLRPLGKIASGGELSRVMLALKSIFARVDRIPVLVFDEVDTGVSGRAAQAIAEKMSRLSRSCQVFSITHLPQVACMADAHYMIQKNTDNERTYTNVYRLDEQGRIAELARMLGGAQVTDTTLHHAKEMLAMADEIKNV